MVFFNLEEREPSCGKKAQSSFEIFLTYAWFIFVIFGVTGILFFGGFFDGLTLSPERCDFFFLGCHDFSVSENELKIGLKNTRNEPIIIRDAIASSDALTGYCRNSLGDIEIDVGEIEVISLDYGDCLAVDTGLSKNYYDINFSYSWSSAPSVKDNFSGVLFASSTCGSGACAVSKVDNAQIPQLPPATPPGTPPIQQPIGISLSGSGLVPLDKVQDSLPVILKRSRGFFADFEKKLVYITNEERHSVQILNVSDPENIEFLDRIIDNDSLILKGAQGIFVDDGLAYVAAGSNSWQEHGVQILNVSDPNNIVALDSIRDSSGLALKSAKDIFVDGNLAYVTSYGDHGVQILNVSDPNNIVALDSIFDRDRYNNLSLDGPRKIFVRGGLAYVTSWTFSPRGVQILNVSNPRNIIALGSIFDNNTLLLGSPYGIFVRDELAYVASEAGDNGIQILNVSDPNNIVALDSIRDNRSLFLNGATNIFVDSKGLAHVASHRDDGIQILNVSDPTNITPVTKIKTPMNNNRYQAPSCKTDKIFVNASLGLAYVGSRGNGCIQVLNLTNYQIMGHESADSFFAFEYPGPVFIEDGLAYVAGTSEGVQILNVTDPTNITFLDSVRGIFVETHEIFVRDKLVYISSFNGRDREGMIQILDARDPSNIRPLYNITPPNGFGYLDIFVDSGRAYATVGNYLYILDVRDLDNIAIVGTTRLREGEIRSIFVDSGRAYLAVEDIENSLHILDVNDPLNIRALGSITDNENLALGRWMHLFVDNGRAYITSSEGVQILDVRNPNNIRALDSIADTDALALDGYIRSRIFVDGNLAYVSSYQDSGVQVLNVSNPNNIVPVTSLVEGKEPLYPRLRFDDEGYFSLNEFDDVRIALRGPLDVFVDNGLVYVTSWHDHGLQVFRFIPPEDN